MRSLLVSASLLMLLAAAGCTGTAARANVAVPALQLAFASTIAPVCESGLAAAHESEVVVFTARFAAFKAAIDSGDVALIVAQTENWRENIAKLFLFGVRARVAAGLLGRNGAKIMVETGRQFDATLTILGAR